MVDPWQTAISSFVLTSLHDHADISYSYITNVHVIDIRLIRYQYLHAQGIIYNQLLFDTQWHMAIPDDDIKLIHNE